MDIEFLLWLGVEDLHIFVGDWQVLGMRPLLSCDSSS